MKLLISIIVLMTIFSCSTGKKSNQLEKKVAMSDKIEKIEKTNEDWKSVLTENEYYVMIDKGTEKPFTGEYWDVFKEGMYKCAACGFELFDSETKFDAHCGWPSFYDSVDPNRIKTEEDFKLGYKRTEIMCAKCGAHLGHVFPDGPNPTGQRYCVNSASIKLDTIVE